MEETWISNHQERDLTVSVARFSTVPVSSAMKRKRLISIEKPAPDCRFGI